jgi:geranylgeranyl pyrophosphate synthase
MITQAQFDSVTAEELRLVESGLRDAVASDVDLLSVAGEYVINSGGKRLRPRTVLLSYKALGGQDVTKAIPLAVAVELLHTASLIHDDINDGSGLRRGHATVNARWGNGLALLVGDYVFVRLLELIAGCGRAVTQEMAKCCTAIVEGETLQALRAGDVWLTESEYLDIVSRKTASLFAVCAKLGGLSAGGTEDQLDALWRYGHSLGIAFQIRDDLLDLMGDSGNVGKPVFSDLTSGKMNVATIFALRCSDNADQVLLSSEKLRVLGWLEQTGALEYGLDKATSYAVEAKRALADLPASDAKAALASWADFAVSREW